MKQVGYSIFYLPLLEKKKYSVNFGNKKVLEWFFDWILPQKQFGIGEIRRKSNFII